jgi:surface antigen
MQLAIAAAMHRTTTTQALLGLTLLAFLAAGCGVGEVRHGLVEDPSQTEHTPGPQIVNPSGEGFGTYTSMPPCHTVLASYDGVDAHSNGPSTGTGYSCGGTTSTGYQYQCVELVMRYFKTKWGLRWYGNAKDLLANAPSSSTDVYTNGDAAHPPVPGDMIVWTKGTWGHVALVVAVRADAVDIIEQNVKGNGRATLGYSNGWVQTRWGTWDVAGWVHAKANTNPSNSGSAPPPPAPTPAPSPSSCHSGAVYGWTYCSAACPCEDGEGDCDSDAECKPGLVCARDVGANYGAHNTVDICQKPASSGGATGGGATSGSTPAPGWSCSASSYKGQQLWTCKSGTIYRCESGAPVKTSCANGCNANPLGTNDTCKAPTTGGNSGNSGGATSGSTPAPGWSCSASSYKGQQLWTCKSGTIYRCESGAPVKTSCASGCNYNPLGTNDTCK